MNIVMNKLTGYKAIGRMVYSTHANGREALVIKCSDPAAATAEANRLRGECFAAQPMTESQMYQAEGRMGLTSEEDDF
jgi:hypothetical protein